MFNFISNLFINIAVFLGLQQAPKPEVVLPEPIVEEQIEVVSEVNSEIAKEVAQEELKEENKVKNKIKAEVYIEPKVTVTEPVVKAEKTLKEYFDEALEKDQVLARSFNKYSSEKPKPICNVEKPIRENLALKLEIEYKETKADAVEGKIVLPFTTYKDLLDNAGGHAFIDPHPSQVREYILSLPKEVVFSLSDFKKACNTIAQEYINQIDEQILNLQKRLIHLTPDDEQRYSIQSSISNLQLEKSGLTSFIRSSY